MNEQLIVRLTEIILAIMALVGIVIVILATWHDFRVILERKKKETISPTNPSVIEGAGIVISVRTLPAVFASLSREMTAKALFWRINDHPKNNIDKPLLLISSSRFPLLASLGLIAYISILTYFFYTAATLRSDTLLTLSWAGVGLWLGAIVWSNEKLSSSDKTELAFAIPFMYFVFYALAFPLLLHYIGQTAKQGGQLLKTYIRQLPAAIQLELYSTRF
jgi:hypothetical protein